MTVRTTLASALLLSAAFALPAAAAPPGASGTTAAGAATPATATTPAPVPGDQAEPAAPQTTAPAVETPPTDVSASGGTATPAQPTTADTGTTTTTTAAAPAPTPTSTAAAPVQATVAVQAEVGAKVIGAQGVTLGTVAGTDAQGGIQVATKNGTTTLAPGLVGMTGGELTAPTVSREDIRQTLADERRSGTIRSRAVTGSGERVQTSAPMEETPAQATPADQPEPPAGVGETSAEQPAQAQPAETPQPANQ